jgi:hypothetical protein
MTHFRDVIKNQMLHSQLLALVDDAQNGWLRDLGKNDFYHSKSIEMLLDRLVPDSVKVDQEIFDHGEIFLLLAAVYLHDIGRKQVGEHHELNSYEMIRRDHLRYHLQNPFVAEAVAQICASHADESVWAIEKCDRSYGIAGLSSSGRTFNLQRLGALLRIADELDNAYVRVDGISAEQLSIRNIIRDVNPVPSKCLIEIQAEPKTWEEWASLLRMKDRCQRRIREVSKYLEDIGLDYYQIWLKPDDYFKPLSPPEDTTLYYDMVETVASLAQSRYSTVDILTNIGGSEISVLCKDRRLGNTHRSAIIVRMQVDKSAAYELRGVLSHLKKDGLIDHGLVVVQEVPNEETSSVLAAHGFPLMSMDGFVGDLYQFDQAMTRYIRAYEDKDIYKRDLFVHPTGSLESSEGVGDLETYIVTWVNSSKEVHLTILGDYGAGKTTLIERISHVAAKEFLNKQSNSRIVVLLRLKDLGTTRSIESAITNVFVNELGIDLSYRAFDALNKAGRFLILLDGFDEIPNMLAQQRVLHAFRQIDKLVEHNSKVILTCRTHFFKNNVEVHRLHEGTALYNSIDQKYGYKMVFIDPFSEPQIEEYLRRWAGQDAERYLQTIRNVYNLSDLATRPALLNIIAKTVPQLDKLEMQTVNASSLYELYVRFWLDRDDWRSELKMSERETLAEALSEYLLMNDLEAVGYALIPDLGMRLSPHSAKVHSIEELDYELRTCNFLKRDHDGNYSFVHRSFMEYLLAHAMFRRVVEGGDDISTSWYLPLEEHAIKANERLASNETQTFFLQMLIVHWHELSFDALTNMLKKRYRAQNLLARTYVKLKAQTFSTLYARLMLDPRQIIGLEYLAKQVMNAADWRVGAYEIELEIRTHRNLDYLREVITALQMAAEEPQQKKLEDLEELLEEIQRSLQPQISDHPLVPEDYPYSRTKGHEDLARALKGLTDEGEVSEARRKWRSRWYREKTEYDKKKRIAKQQQEDEQYEKFNKDLRRKKKR